VRSIQGVLNWLSETHPGLILLGSGSILPNTIDIGGDEVLTRSDFQGREDSSRALAVSRLEVEVILWDMTTRAASLLPQQAQRHPNCLEVWEGFKRLLNALLSVERWTHLITSPEQVKNGPVSEYGASTFDLLYLAMSRVVCSLLPAPARFTIPDPSLQNRRQGCVGCLDEAGTLLCLLQPSLKTIRSMLQVKSMSCRFDPCSWPGFAHEDAILHSPAVGAWAALVDLIAPSSNLDTSKNQDHGINNYDLSESPRLALGGCPQDLARLILLHLVHFALFGAVSEDEFCGGADSDEGSVCWPDPYRRVFVSTLAIGLLSSKCTTASSPYSTAIDMWPIFHRTLPPDVLGLLMLQTERDGVQLPAGLLLVAGCFRQVREEDAGKPPAGSGRLLGTFDPFSVLDSSWPRKLGQDPRHIDLAEALSLAREKVERQLSRKKRKNRASSSSAGPGAPFRPRQMLKATASETIAAVPVNPAASSSVEALVEQPMNKATARKTEEPTNNPGTDMPAAPGNSPVLLPTNPGGLKASAHSLEGIGRRIEEQQRFVTDTQSAIKSIKEDIVKQMDNWMQKLGALNSAMEKAQEDLLLFRDQFEDKTGERPP